MTKTFTSLNLFFLSLASFAQDAYFTNPAHSLVYLNPSFSGSNEFIRNQTAYRNQWPNLSGPTFVSIANSFDAYIKPLRAGISLTTFLDDQGNGTLKTNCFSFAYAQNFFLFDRKLKVVPSVQATYFEEKLDKTKLNFGGSYNFRFPMMWNNLSMVPISSKTNYDFTSGLLFQNRYLRFGASLFHLLQPDIGLAGIYKLPVRTTLHFSYAGHLSRDSYFNLSGFANLQSANAHAQINWLMAWKALLAGLGGFYEKIDYISPYYPQNYTGTTEFDNLIFTAGFHVKWISFMYTYDANVFSTNESVTKNVGSHQLSLSLNFKSKKDTPLSRATENW